jgi:xylulokinase
MRSDTPLILSLDIGTTALKVGLFSIDGELLHIESREQELLFLPGDRVEQSPQKTWSLLTHAVQKSMDGYDPRSVKAISLSIQRGTVVPLDQYGNPLTDQVVWMDKRSVPLTNYISEVIGSDFFYHTSCTPISYITGVSKLLWFQHQGGEVWDRLKVLAPPQTLFLRWLGCEELVCDRSLGTYLFPFDIDQKTWSTEIAQRLNFPLECLPKLVEATEIVGYLSEKTALEMNLVPGIPLVAGGGDGQCAGIGCGIVEPGLVMINIGTGTGVQAYLREPLRDPLKVLNCAAHVDPIGWEMEGHTQSSGIAFRWFRDEFGDLEILLGKKANLDAFDLLILQAKDVPPGSEGLLFIPTFNGSNAPIINQNARAAILGLNLSHQRKHVIHALLEGISFEIRWILDAMKNAGIPIDTVNLVGGGSKNNLWNQMHADILNKPINTIYTTDAALVGVAMCSAVAIGEYKNIKEASNKFVKIKETIEPQKNNVRLYENIFSKYCKTFMSLCEHHIFDDLIQ